MNKVAHYLQQHLVGEVLTSTEVLDYFSTDESIFSIRPLLVVHPRNENDVRKAARFSWQLAERGRKVPITIKGKGTDQTGASLGNGIILSTPAHLNKIIELDPKSGSITVESGTIISKVQQTLHTHGRFLPAMTDSAEYSTIGGAVANNDAGPTSYKYGPVREYVRGLRVVLANGELIRTERISKRELNKKLGLASFEGEVYRALDKLIEDSQDAIAAYSEMSDRSNVGYAINDVKLKDGSFDLSPLLVGSQGTLGLVTEISLDTEPFSAQTDLSIALFSSREAAWKAVSEINGIKGGPISMDFVDKTLIEYVQSVNSNLVKTTLENAIPETVLFIETEKTTVRSNRKISKKIQKILKTAEAEVFSPKTNERDGWRALRDSPSLFLSHSTTGSRAVPLVDDAAIPVANCAEFITKAEALFDKYGQKTFAFWGQAGNGFITAAPLFDVSQVGDRQKMFKLLNEFYLIVAEAGGSVAGQSAEGRLRGMQVDKTLKPEAIELMNSIKTIFDPH
ncbi:MAG: FAD/FMN-containing dehydrogenase, partial [Candidatus Saccharimonadales bacterium]